MKKLALFLAFLLLLFVGVSIATNPHVPRGPVIVSDLSFTAQTSGFGPATVFTPTDSGLYRVVIYGESSDQLGTFSVTMTWTDDFGANFKILSNEGFPGQGSRIVFATAGNPITITTSPSLSTGATYNTFVIVEQL